MMDHDILTIEEVAQYLRVSERTIYDWASKGTIPCGKLGTTWRFKRTELEKWVDKKLAPPKATPAPHAIAIADVLSPERIVFLETTRKNEALNAVIDCLVTAPQVKDRDELTREIFYREELMSTGIGFNVAVPHVRLDSITDLVMAAGVSKKGIADYAALDEQPVRLICMVAARADQHAKYLKTLGAVSALLRSESVRTTLLAADTPETAYDILTK